MFLTEDKEEPLINMFLTEIRKYITPKENLVGKKINICLEQREFTTLKMELETYMDYDDWNLAQNLIVNRCDPLPTSRCLARAS